MGDRLATIDMGRKLEGQSHFFWGGAGFPSNTMSPGPRPTSVPSGILIHPAVWPQYTWAEVWGCTLGGRAGSPSNTSVARGEAYFHAKSHLDPSNRVVTIYQRYRQDGTDRQTDRQRFDNIGRTVLQTVPKNARRIQGHVTNFRCYK